MTLAKNNIISKGIFALAFVAIAGVIGGVSFAQSATADKPTKEECANAGYSNYGQCVSEWAHNKNNGYGTALKSEN